MAAPLSLDILAAAKRTGTLDLRDSRLSTLPDLSSVLPGLRVLDLRRNGFTAIPPTIFGLRHLQTLNLNNNQLTRVPPEISQLQALQTLSLTYNQIEDLPVEITAMRALRRLLLSRNRIAEIWPEIGQMPNLKGLSLNGNGIASLPGEIGELKQLVTLHLGANELAEVPTELGELSRLQTLNLSANQLTSLPPEIGQLTRLQRLHLGSNRLTELPAEIAQLKRLQVLDAGRNQLTSLPKDLAVRIDEGLKLALDGNPAGPMVELWLRGPAALSAYLRSLDDAVEQYEAKLLLVGEGNVGKTSLVAALKGDEFVEQRLTTHGIEIHELSLAHPSMDISMTLRIWDFGGQEVYRITHQFFFSRNAVFLVVWHPRAGYEQNEVEQWLHRIRLRIESEAAVLIVATHSEDRRAEIAYSRLKNDHPMLRGHFEIDSRTGQGVDRLRQAVAENVASLPHMGQKLSARWSAARTAVLARAAAQPQISFEEFQTVCQDSSVALSEVPYVAQLMHDLGQIIYYGDDQGLADIVVLSPEWLTKAISHVLEDPETRDHHGILAHHRLRSIWYDRAEGATYLPQYHAYFLRLMEKFDISYRLPGQDASLVGQMVAYERPQLPWEANSAPAAGLRVLRLLCEFQGPAAEGLIPWLIVRNHGYSVGLHWRDGMFLRHPISAYGADALMELVDQRAVLTLEVRAPSPNLFFNVLWDGLEAVLAARSPGLRYTLQVPCPTRLSNGASCTGRFPLSGLHGYKQDGGRSYRCLDCQCDHEIVELLTGFEAAGPATLLSPEINEVLRTIALDTRETRVAAAENANLLRRMTNALDQEISDCPRLFYLATKDPRLLKRIGRKNLTLTLWCEQPDELHPLTAATYEFSVSKDWLLQARPYISVVLNALTLATTVSGVTLNTGRAGVEMAGAIEDLKAMRALVDAMEEDTDDSLVDPVDGPTALTTAEGAALRAFRVLLFEIDPTKAFGGLRRVPSPSGKYLWVCKEHYSRHDPGLPNLPAAGS